MSEEQHLTRRNFITLCQELADYLPSFCDLPEFGKRLDALGSDSERVDFFVDLLNTSKITVDFQTDIKNDEVAVKFRELGNEMFKIKKLKEAWEFYTQSICHAEENSANLGIAYANRSAVFFEVNLQKECLTDIKRALDHNYPEHLKQKLQVREQNAKSIKNNISNKPHEDLPSIPQKNPKIQSASNSLQLQENETFGRHVVATKDIKAGEILVVEKPFVSLVINGDLSHCHECINLCYNLIPCKRCTCAMYCSETCRDRAFETFHKYECPILATIRYLQFDRIQLLPMKIALLVRDQCGENLRKSSSEVYRSDSYKEIHNLLTNASKRCASDLFTDATCAAIMFNLLKDQTDFFKDADVKLEEFFKEVLFLHLETGPTNFHEISEFVPDSAGVYKNTKVATAVFAFLSLFNHSCCPNVHRFCYGTSMVLRAIQNIQKGEQLFDNYGYHYSVMDKTERQKHLKTQYHFDCTCRACENNWPEFFSYSVDDEFLLIKLASGDLKLVKAVLQSFLEQVGDLQESQPSQLFCQVQEFVQYCFSILGNKRKLF